MDPLTSEQDNTLIQLRRYKWVLVTFWTGVIAISLAWNVYQEKHTVDEMACSTAGTAFEKDILYRRWNAMQGGVYAPVTEATPPNPYLKVPGRDIKTPGGQVFTKINPAYMIRQVHELAEKQYGTKGHITSLNPLRPENAPDDWEAEALKAFEDGVTEVHSVETLDGQRYMRLMRPLYTEQSCLKCHGKQGYKLGDVRGGLSVSVPMAPLQAIARSRIVALYYGYGGLWLMGLVGVAVGMRHVRRHVRRRGKAEEALQGAKDYTDNIISSMIDMLVVVAPGGTITTVNEATCTLLGYSEDELIGQPSGLLFSDDDDGGGDDEEDDTAQLIVSQEVLPFKRTMLRRLVKDGSISNIEKALRAKGGHEIPVLISGSVMREKDGTIQAIVCVAQDITERKRAEERLLNAKHQAEEVHANLQEAHAKIRQLLGAISSVFVGVDVDGRVTVWNETATRTLGIERENAEGQLLGDLSIEWDYATIAESIAQCQAENRPVRMDDLRFKRPDGTDGFLGITLNPVEADAGKDVGILLVAADITEHKILQGQLTQAQKLESIGQLAAGIAHEINTPTQFVGDNTRFLQDAFQDLQALLAKYALLVEAGRTGSVPPEVLADVEAAEKDADLEYLAEEIPQAITQSLEGIERVTRIVRAMKDFSHPGAEGKEAVDLNKAIESTVTVARNEWKYVAEMVMKFDPDLPAVRCLVGEFNQVILNIVINAAHAIADVVGKDGGEKGTITITTRHDGDWAEIRIADSGTGIAEKNRSKVFDHFFTTKEVGKGTGQGLAIAHAVVTEKHGGSINLESEVGKGTTFIIRLPIEPDSATEEETPQHEEACSIH